MIGTLVSDPENGYIRLPRRAADSGIADAWKKTSGATGQADTDDLDNEPVGNGLSLHEEYRGSRTALVRRRKKGNCAGQICVSDLWP